MSRQLLTLIGLVLASAAVGATPTHTEVSIRGENFFVNGRPTYAGRAWQGHSIEGLLFNSRMVQGVFDDLNPATRVRWNYPDGGRGTPNETPPSSLPRCPSGSDTA